MNKVNHKKIYYHGILLLLISFCADTKIKIHPDKAGIRYSDSIFYEQTLPGLKNKSVMIISNPSGIGSNPGRIVSEFRKNNVRIKFFLGLEHGFLGLDEQFSRVPVTIDPLFNLPVYHIYKLQESEIRELISQVDAVILDVQDMGMRCYTYVSVLKRVMDQMHGKKQLIVLDHINPGMLYKPMGEDVKKKYVNFAADFPLPIITGLSLGESAMFYNREYLQNSVNVEVIRVKGYSRGTTFEESGIKWSTPSPNLPVMESARNYFALVLLEGVNLSVGRGTQAPFIYFGAPWLDGRRLIDELNSNSDGKYYFQTVFFKPTFGPYAGKICKGLRLNVTDASYDPVKLAYELIAAIKKTFPESFVWESSSHLFRVDQLWGTSSFRRSIDKGMGFDEFHKRYEAKEREAYKTVKKYYMY